jgi:N-acyl-D-aspartate/D-glutamate deacylase
MVARLADPELRPKIAARTDADLAQGWNNILIAAVASPKNHGLVGKSVAEIAFIKGQSPVEAAIDLLIEEAGRVNMLEVNQSEAQPPSNLVPIPCRMSSVTAFTSRVGLIRGCLAPSRSCWAKSVSSEVG